MPALLTARDKIRKMLVDNESKQKWWSDKGQNIRYILTYRWQIQTDPENNNNNIAW
jgi:hypothetical protein